MSDNLDKKSIAFYITCVILGVAALVLKNKYTGNYQDVVLSYLGNFAVSFAIYFMIRVSAFGKRIGRLVTAGLVLLAVELFEITNGFGLMSNVFDWMDLLVNLLGVGFAMALDSLISRKPK